MNKFERFSAALFFATTFVVGADVLVRKEFESKESNISINTNVVTVNVNGRLSTGTTLSLEDPITHTEIPLNLGDPRTSAQYDAVLSPDYRKIVFIMESWEKPKPTPGSSFYLVVSDIAGKNQTKLVDYSPGAGRGVAWIDSNTVVFNYGGISTIKTDGSQRTKLTYTEINFQRIDAFCFDKDTGRIFFAGAKFNSADQRDTYYEIHSIEPNGTNPQKVVTLDKNLTTGGVFDIQCQNDQIVLVLTPGDHLKSYTLNKDGSDLQIAK